MELQKARTCNQLVMTKTDLYLKLQYKRKCHLTPNHEKKSYHLRQWIARSVLKLNLQGINLKLFKK